MKRNDDITLDLLKGLGFKEDGDYLVHQAFLEKFNSAEEGSRSNILIFTKQDFDANGSLIACWSNPNIKTMQQVNDQLNKG